MWTWEGLRVCLICVFMFQAALKCCLGKAFIYSVSRCPHPALCLAVSRQPSDRRKGCQGWVTHGSTWNCIIHAFRIKPPYTNKRRYRPYRSILANIKWLQEDKVRRNNAQLQHWGDLCVFNFWRFKPKNKTYSLVLHCQDFVWQLFLSWVSHQCFKDEVRSGDKNAWAVSQCKTYEDGQPEYDTQAHIHHAQQ